MKYIEVPGGDPAFHQAFEQIVFEQVRDESVLLLWVNDPAVVCGAYQNIFQEASVYRAQKRGIAVVRRDSGGGTVYHDRGNLNFTTIRDFGGQVDYDSLLAGMLEALRRIGLPAQKSRICDISLRGKKISGGAQRIAKGRILHHGTLLFNADLAALHEIAGRTGRVYVSKAVRSNPAEVLNVREYWGGEMEDFRKALLHAYPAELHEAGLTTEQLGQVRRLADEKYRTWAWAFGRSPAFTCKVSGDLGGSPCTIDYEAKKGVVTQFELVSPILEPDAGRRFIGAPLRPGEIEALCREVTDDPETLVDLIF